MATKHLDQCIESLMNFKMLSERDMKHIVQKGIEIVSKEPNVVPVPAPCTVVGDIHGQLHDLMELFEICGKPPDTNYVFMGDYVDRGYFSVETVTLAICLKIRYPQRITLLRGNHESRQITQIYGFYEEAVKKYGSVDVWTLLTDFFDNLPLSALIENSILCVHGGISPAVRSVDSIRELERIQEIPQGGTMSDLLWSDPEERQDFGTSPRGAGWVFGGDKSEEFLNNNKLTLLLRAHQLMENGFGEHHNKHVYTLFSAPNYCYRCCNLGAVMEISENLDHKIIQFTAAPGRGSLPPARP
ncbi:putative Serine/threonine-protein phosphatase PP2A-1 catalytic subunit [Blattamonas nauphoetae]|uniref:Serine/threonine-protein phosphatase n=1 Tax=Blattamonas nauphoetae TaxID=2049346 RepID=A0ABQ9XIH8_9EUKA|nr:putative Serine/threonine-protein phosphatase PP2A-1 catalytic subunit [Blattamonas nauphoetae]